MTGRLPRGAANVGILDRIKSHFIRRAEDGDEPVTDACQGAGDAQQVLGRKWDHKSTGSNSRDSTCHDAVDRAREDRAKVTKKRSNGSLLEFFGLAGERPKKKWGGLVGAPSLTGNDDDTTRRNGLFVIDNTNEGGGLFGNARRVDRHLTGSRLLDRVDDEHEDDRRLF